MAYATPDFSGVDTRRTLTEDYNAASPNTDLADAVFSAAAHENFRQSNEFYNRLGLLADWNSIRGMGKSISKKIVDEGPKVRRRTPGEWDDGDLTTQMKVTATVDEALQVSEAFPEEDISIDHTNAFALKGAQQGKELAEETDNIIARMLAAASLEAAITEVIALPGGAAGSAVVGESTTRTVRRSGNNVFRTSATLSAITDVYPLTSDGADNFIADVSELAKDMDDNFCPRAGRLLFINTHVAQVLQNTTAIFDRDYSSASGDRNRRQLPMLNGFELIVTTQLPNGDFGSSFPSEGALDFQIGTDGASDGQPVAVAACTGDPSKKAILGCETIPLSTLVSWQDRNIGYYLTAYMQYGMAIFHPSVAGGIFIEDVT